VCLAVPSRIVSIDDLQAVVDVFGARKEVNLILLPEEVSVGDFVLVHTGFAIQKIDEDAARESMQLIQEMAALLEEADEIGMAGDRPHLPV
jgi:hydrogenase expression/formation protein HypC